MKIRENMKEDEELEMLLDEIPHAISLNLNLPDSNGHHVHHGGQEIGSFVKQTMGGMMCGIYDDDASYIYKNRCASPVSEFSLQSDGSSSSLFSAIYSLSENGSPTSPPLEELKPRIPCGNSHSPIGSWINSRMPDLHSWNKTNVNLTDGLNLSRSFSRISINDEQEDLSVVDRCRSGTNRTNLEKFGPSDNYMRGHPDYWGLQSSVPRSPSGFDGKMRPALSKLQHEYETNRSLGLRYCPDRNDGMDPLNSPRSSQCRRTKEQPSYYFQRRFPASNSATSMNRPSVSDALFYAQRSGMNLNEERGVLPNTPQLTHPRLHLNVENELHYGTPMLNGNTREPSSIRIPQCGLEAFEDSLIIQEEGLNYVIDKGFGRSRGHYHKGSLDETGVGKLSGISEKDRSIRTRCPFSVPSNLSSVVEARGYIYLMAKDQNGCRSLQRAFDEGTPWDVQMIFNEIIDHVVELMMNPFGNYLMQKLLEVCNEEQRMQILFMVTEEPGDLIRISLNTHGTRVVQKLIDTLKTRRQILLVISAIEPGFLALIKDLNGNHVIQRCLQCLSNEDNEFIFAAAAKYCVDIATHQHGCCVLQRCITRSTGAHRDNLIAEISANGLLLAQDAFGNYVIQFILELKNPSATSNLNFQFEGNYLHLSTQKFSSHVVEKCLMVADEEIRSKIIHEFLSASHFEQLLQDPHANYVVQTALRVAEGPLRNLLVEAIESHKAISRNSPYSKRIFSQKLLKK